MSEAAFDELIHAPLRLQICAMLSPVRWLPFSDIRDSLQISDSVLSKHLSALAEAGYVEVSRVRADSRSRRQVTLTNPGRTALRGHLAALQAITAAAQPAMVEKPSNARAPKRRQAEILPSILGSRRLPSPASESRIPSSLDSIDGRLFAPEQQRTSLNES